MASSIFTEQKRKITLLIHVGIRAIRVGVGYLCMYTAGRLLVHVDSRTITGTCR